MAMEAAVKVMHAAKRNDAMVNKPLVLKPLDFVPTSDSDIKESKLVEIRKNLKVNSTDCANWAQKLGMRYASATTQGLLNPLPAAFTNLMQHKITLDDYNSARAQALAAIDLDIDQARADSAALGHLSEVSNIAEG